MYREQYGEYACNEIEVRSLHNWGFIQKDLVLTYWTTSTWRPNNNKSADMCADITKTLKDKINFV